MSKELLDCCIELPNIQRIRDESKVDEIVSYQRQQLLNNGHCDFHGVINIHHCQETDRCFLVDGQHRFEALRKLSSTHNVELFVEIEQVINMDQLINNYNIINKNTPLPEFPESIDKNIPEEVAQFFKNKYPDMWSNSRNARRPHIYFNYFQEALGFLTEKLNIKTADELKEIVATKNVELSAWTIDNYPKSRTITEAMMNKCTREQLYLGLYAHESEDYAYQWVKDIVFSKTGERIAKPKKPRKANIPKALKMTIWDEYVGKDKRRALCICCCDREIEINNCVYGHIVSEKHGGQANVENLLPICAQCNGSMGAEHMGEYVERSYPKNLINFQNKKYTYQKPSSNFILNFL
jgi:hypothetical protein